MRAIGFMRAYPTRHRYGVVFLADKLQDVAYLASLVQIEFPGAAVRIMPQMEGSENRHGVATVSNSTERLFVKFYSGREKYRVESAALGTLGSAYDWPILPVAGSDSTEIAWLAFPHIQLEQVTRSPQTLREWGTRLAEVHLSTPPGVLGVSPRAVDTVDQRLVKLAECSEMPVVAEATTAAERLWSRVRDTVGTEAREHHTRNRLLTNDFGFRNTYRLPSGVMTLIDFERATVGDPHWELGL
jgi:hypothetical protein